MGTLLREPVAGFPARLSVRARPVLRGNAGRLGSQNNKHGRNLSRDPAQSVTGFLTAGSGRPTVTWIPHPHPMAI